MWHIVRTVEFAACVNSATLVLLPGIAAARCQCVIADEAAVPCIVPNRKPRPIMQLVDRALALPPFLAGCFMLYWSLPLSVLMNKVKFLKLYGKRDDAFGWCADSSVDRLHLQQQRGITT